MFDVKHVMLPTSPSDDALTPSLPVWQRHLGSERPDQRIFYLLLDIESRLRAEARRDTLLQARQRRTATVTHHK